MQPLEHSPSDNQKHRVENWLTELKIICRKYRLLLDTEDGETTLIDLDSGRVVGIGLTYLIDDRAGRARITAYDLSGSILDGVWMVEDPAQPGEYADQRDIQGVHPGPPDHLKGT